MNHVIIHVIIIDIEISVIMVIIHCRWIDTTDNTLWTSLHMWSLEYQDFIWIESPYFYIFLIFHFFFFFCRLPCFNKSKEKMQYPETRRVNPWRKYVKIEEQAFDESMWKKYERMKERPSEHTAWKLVKIPSDLNKWQTLFLRLLRHMSNVRRGRGRECSKPSGVFLLC